MNKEIKKLDLPLTLLIDIDGVLVHQTEGNWSYLISKGVVPELLPKVQEKFVEWDKKGYRIILTTGRRESSRKVTEEQLAAHGIIYDQLVMGCGNGQRVLINDLKPEHPDVETAIAINLKRNEGIGDLKL